MRRLTASSQTSDPRAERLLPDEFLLSRNIPNPFSSNTVIGFGLTEPAHLKLEVFDLLGRKVVTLIDGPKQAGFHSVAWNADSFASGIYFYRIEAGEFTKSEKMILLK